MLLSFYLMGELPFRHSSIRSWFDELHTRIRNYMSKDWFQGALDAQPASALSSQIKQALGKK
jgi:hypothetical protein